MPINFEAPQAFDSSAAEGYGKLQQENARAQFQLKVAEARAQASARDQANANDVSRMNAQVNIASDDNRTKLLQSQEAIQGRQNQEMLQQEGQGQRQQAEFNYADNIRLQNLQQGRAYIQAQLDAGQISPEEANVLRTQVSGRIDALEFQKQQTQIKQEQQQTTRLMHQTAMAASANTLNATFQANALPNATVRHYDDSGNLMGITHPDGHGGFHTLQAPRPQGEGGTAGGARPITPVQLAGFRRSAEQAVSRDPAFIGKPQAEIEAEVARRVERWTAQPGAAGTLPPRPIDLPDDAPLTRLPAPQRRVLQGLNEDQAILTGANSRRSETEKAEINSDIARFRQLFRQFGGRERMPPEEREEADAIIRNLDEWSGRVPSNRSRSGPASGPPPSPASPRPGLESSPADMMM